MIQPGYTPSNIGPNYANSVNYNTGNQSFQPQNGGPQPEGNGGQNGSMQQQQSESGQLSQQSQQQEYSLAGVLHFLQTEWRRYERDRNEWEIERAEMRVSFINDAVRSSSLKLILILLSSGESCFARRRTSQCREPQNRSHEESQDAGICSTTGEVSRHLFTEREHHYSMMLTNFSSIKGPSIWLLAEVHLVLVPLRSSLLSTLRCREWKR